MFSVGPGCSSVGVGAFSENGPFRPRGQVLVRNEHSWNKGGIFFTLFYSVHYLGIFSQQQKIKIDSFLNMQRQICYTWSLQLGLASLIQLIHLPMRQLMMS